MTRARRSSRRRWTPAEIAILVLRYPHERTENIAIDLGRPTKLLYAKANDLGLAKIPEYLASPDACRLRRGDGVGKEFRFRPGQVPANKGLRRPGWSAGRMRETQFKKGQFPPNKDPGFYVLGALRVNTEGYIEMRTSFAQGSSGWRGLHRILWEDAHGPIPRSHCLVFRDRDKLNVELENLELITLAENMRRNSIHRLPPQLRNAIQTLGALKRAINRRTREEQDRRPA